MSRSTTTTAADSAAAAAAAAPHHHHQSRTPLHRRPVFRLIVLAVICFMGIAVLLRPAAHEEHWWRHVGLKDRRSGNATPGPERIVFSDDGIAFEANVRHEDHHLNKHHDEKGIQIIGDHENNMPPKRSDVVVVAKKKEEEHPIAGEVLSDLHPGEKRTERDERGHPIMRPLVQGVDYFSDFDVHKVGMDPDPEPRADVNHGKNFFTYIDPATNTDYAMQYISNAPRVLVIQDLLTHKECDQLVEAASRKLFRSQVAPVLGSKASSAVNDVRTSSQAWLSAGSPEVKPIVDRLLKMTGLPHGSNEELQVLKYEKNQKYDAHNDYFDPKMYGAQSSNRAVTIFLYLSDVEEGGETQFPRADGKPPTFDFTSCTRGLRLRPRKGQAALFYDMKPNGVLDPSSLHGGCPVRKGVKWGGTLWLRVPTGGV